MMKENTVVPNKYHCFGISPVSQLNNSKDGAKSKKFIAQLKAAALLKPLTSCYSHSSVNYQLNNIHFNPKIMRTMRKRPWTFVYLKCLPSF